MSSQSSEDAAEASQKETKEIALIPSHAYAFPSQEYSLARNLYLIINYTPRRCRYDPEKPFEFSLPLNLLFSFAATFTVANLYYTHPILNKLAEDFNVNQQRVSIIPTLAQTGYAAGLLFLCPLGDLFRRRTFVLLLVWFTATVWIGLCITNSFELFSFLSFLTALTTVTPQLMLPLVGELAPAHRRATALSIVVSGLVLGILIARVLSGIVTEYTSWRNIYWLAFGLQYCIFGLLWLFLPDYPSSNPDGLNYFKMLWSIVKLVFKYPVLVQACLISLCTSSVFTSYWTTLTFLLASPPYNYSPLIIGLFALIGIFSFFFSPIYSRFIIDKVVPIYSVILGEMILLIGQVVGTYTGTFTVAGPIIQAFLLDLGLIASQIANRTSIYTIEPKARNRVNTAYMISTFGGQLVGTSVGAKLYADGGWIRSGSAGIGFIGLALVFCFARGPGEEGWVGWSGSWSLRRRDLDDAKKAGGKSDEERGVESKADSFDGDASIGEKIAEKSEKPTEARSDTNFSDTKR